MLILIHNLRLGFTLHLAGDQLVVRYLVLFLGGSERHLMVEEVLEDAPHCDIAQQEPDHGVSASASPHTCWVEIRERWG